jgi:uncharacterized protein (TIGR00266 family)
MKVNISSQPSYSIAYITLDVDEVVECETDAMVAMSTGIEVSGSASGGVISSAIRKYAAGETFFRSKYISRIHGGWVAVASRYPGDISVIELSNNAYLIQSGSILANAESVEIESRFSGITTMVQKEGFVVSRAIGMGELLICAYGGLEKIHLESGQNLIVDTGHLVAWSESLSVKVGPLNSAATATLTGEGLVAMLTGPGELYIQTRSERGIRQWLFPKRNEN